MKTIKGKVSFGCVPIPNDASHERIYMEGTVFVDTPKKRAIICGNVHEFGSCKILCKLSEVTEELASLLVDCHWKASETTEYKTAKESLFSLLKANGRWIKEWKDEPIRPTFGAQFEGTTQWECFDSAMEDYGDELELYDNTPDDYLLIIKQ